MTGAPRPLPHPLPDDARAALRAVQDRLTEELFALRVSPSGQVPVATFRALLTGMVPEVAARLCVCLTRALDGGASIIGTLFTTTIYGDREAGDLGQLIRAHLTEYAATLRRWDGWEPQDLFSDEDGTEWAQPWLRKEDGVIACDYVGGVYQPRRTGHPTRAFSAFWRNATKVHEAMIEDYITAYTGMRLFILGEDDRPVVRWLHNEEWIGPMFA